MSAEQVGASLTPDRDKTPRLPTRPPLVRQLSYEPDDSNVHGLDTTLTSARPRHTPPLALDETPALCTLGLPSSSHKITATLVDL
jgi:hypothetical protein